MTGDERHLESLYRRRDAIIAERDALRAENEKLRGAMNADDERLRAAERRVYGEKTWGCDAPEVMAESILGLRAEIERHHRDFDRWENDALREKQRADSMAAEVEKLRAVEFMASAYRAAEEDWWEYASADEDGTLDNLIGCEDGDENGAEGERRQSNMTAMRDHLDAALDAAKLKGE